jgi:hypothetical protein
LWNDGYHGGIAKCSWLKGCLAEWAERLAKITQSACKIIQLGKPGTRLGDISEVINTGKVVSRWYVNTAA